MVEECGIIKSHLGIASGHLYTVSLPTCWDGVCMAAGGQAAALGVKRRPFAAKIKNLTINTRATPSRAGGGGGERKTENQIFIALPSKSRTLVPRLAAAAVLDRRGPAREHAASRRRCAVLPASSQGPVSCLLSPDT